MYPKITIVTPNYNQDKFLEDTVQSVLNQNYPNLEYIIIDGGSTDRSVDIIRKYEKHLAYWISEPDEGMYEAIQKGFDVSTGEIMAWINSDDMYHKNSFFTVADIFLRLKEVQWLSGANTNFDEQGRTVNVQHSYQFNKYSQFLYPNKYIQQESTFWRRSLWKMVGSSLNLSLKYAGDFELWLRFNRFSQLYITDALIGGFRIRKNQLTQLFMDRYILECNKALLNEKNLFSYNDNAILEEIIDLTRNLKYATNQAKPALEKKIKILSKENEKIYFHSNDNKLKLRNTRMNSILSTSKKRRNNMKDLLEMIKIKHSYYPEVIIDVGVAQGTPALYNTFPKSNFLLFEALEEFIPDIEKNYLNVKSMNLELCALGKYNGEISINVHPDLVGSSIYIENEDSNVNGDPRTVAVNTLNSFKDKYKLFNKNILLKIDVQGAELDVLEGSREIFEFIDVIILEVSLFDFFGNNVIFSDVINFMSKNNFVTYDIFDFSNRPLDSALSQVDVAFVKKDSLFRKSNIFATEEQRAILNSEFKSKNHMMANGDIINKENFSFSQKYNIFYQSIKDLGEIYSEIIVYGNGTIGKTIQTLIPEKIIGYVDVADENYHPKKLTTIKFDKIIVSVLGREDEIVSYLVEELNIESSKIIVLNL